MENTTAQNVDTLILDKKPDTEATNGQEVSGKRWP